MVTPLTSMRLDVALLALLDALAMHLGVTRTEAVRVAVREAARRRKLSSPGT